MAPGKKKPRGRKPSKTDKTILDQFLSELELKLDDEEVTAPLTKGQALIKTIVNESLKGDQRMLGNVLKLIEKLESAQEATQPTEEKNSKAEWENLFSFYAKYRPLIELEIDRLKATNPDYWNFDWFKPMIKTAPWYQALHGK